MLKHGNTPLVQVPLKRPLLNSLGNELNDEPNTVGVGTELKTQIPATIGTVWEVLATGNRWLRLMRGSRRSYCVFLSVKKTFCVYLYVFVCVSLFRCVWLLVCM